MDHTADPEELRHAGYDELPPDITDAVGPEMPQTPVQSMIMSRSVSPAVAVGCIAVSESSGIDRLLAAHTGRGHGRDGEVIPLSASRCSTGARRCSRLNCASEVSWHPSGPNMPACSAGKQPPHRRASTLHVVHGVFLLLQWLGRIGKLWDKRDVTSRWGGHM